MTFHAILRQCKKRVALIVRVAKQAPTRSIQRGCKIVFTVPFARSFFFCTFLGFKPDNDKVSRRAQINQNNDDRRGKHELKHKINHKIVPGHVEKYKPSGGISNYSRENASLRRNCPSELTLKEMHKNLCETSGRQVSMNLYHKTQYLICRVRTREVRSLSKFVSPQTKIWL